MIISHQLKFIFIHVQRTGGTSIVNSLKKELGKDIEVISQHGNTQIDEENLLTKFDYYFKFGFVRNPWDRIFSWYSLVHKWDILPLDQEKVRFENFLMNYLSVSEKDDPYFHFNQLDYFKNKNGELITQRIGRFENYNDDFKSICENIRISNIQIEKINSTNLKNYRNYYSEKTQTFIAEKCKEDIEYFSYSF